MSTKKAAQGQKKGPATRSVCSGPFSPKLFYVILVMPLHSGKGAVCIDGGLAPCQNRWFFHTSMERSRGSGSGTFLEKLPGALKAKGGMSDESDGDSYALHGHFRFSGIDRGRSPSGR